MKTLVIYFSAQGHTRRIAKEIANKLRADSFEIMPETPYTEDDLDWRSDQARAAREHDDESLRDIALKDTTAPNWDEYGRVVIVYPIWWGIAAWATDSFIKASNWDGKTVYPVAVSHSSPLGDSDARLAVAAGAGDWRQGKRFGQDATEDEIDDWVAKL